VVDVTYFYGWVWAGVDFDLDEREASISREKINPGNMLCNDERMTPNHREDIRGDFLRTRMSMMSKPLGA